VVIILSLCDLHKALLDKLNCPGHGIQIDFYAWEQIRITPPIDPGGCPTKLDLCAALRQIGDKILVGVSSRDVTRGIIRIIVERHMTGIRVKHRDHVGLGVPFGDVPFDQLEVEKRGRQIALKLQIADAVHRLHELQLDGDIDNERMIGIGHGIVPFSQTPS